MANSTKGEVFDPPSIWPILQVEDNECVIAAIATLIGVAYLDVRAAAGGRISGDGLTQREIVKVLRTLGYRCRQKRRIDWENDCGLLTTVFPASQHVCVLWRGVLFDPADGRVWEDAETYLTIEGVRASVLTVLEAISPRG